MSLCRCLTFLLCACAWPALAADLLLAVAANFNAPMTEIAQAFEEETGHDVELAFGSSGKLYAQIVHGAPFDLFFSADAEKPLQLEQAGLTVANSRFTYALGALALWSPEPSLLAQGPAVLSDARFGKLALANPRLAPYGAAAIEVMEQLDVVTATKAKWVFGENIAQTYHFVLTRNADLGFVALSQILENGGVARGSAWRVPARLHQPIRQDAVILRRSEALSAARAFADFITGERASAIIIAHGYSLSENSEHSSNEVR